MKKILQICIIGVILLSGFGAAAINNDNNIIETNNLEIKALDNEKLKATHTVLGEYGTATWCGYCKYAHGALKEIYSEANYDFYYVSLVCDKNSAAYSRAKDDFNLYGYPTVWFDGGYRVRVGAGSVPSAKSGYISSISGCGSRAVYDINIDLSASWLGGTNMQIDVIVENNEASTYNGRIRVYITEIISSMGWKDTAGDTYTFPLLDFAFNENISISAGGTWSDTTTWDGSSHGYGSITQDNILVIAAVFNDEWHEGYSYPPNNNPFDAYYLDDCIGFRVGNNRAPEAPEISGPASGVVEVEYNYTFSVIDQDWFDEVYFYIDWGDGNTEEWIGPYSSSEEIIISHTWTEKDTYTIKAKAKDNNDAEGPEATKEVTMPKNTAVNFNQILSNFLHQHPYLHKILERLLK